MKRSRAIQRSMEPGKTWDLLMQKQTNGLRRRAHSECWQHGSQVPSKRLTFTRWLSTIQAITRTLRVKCDVRFVLTLEQSKRTRYWGSFSHRVATPTAKLPRRVPRRQT